MSAESSSFRVERCAAADRAEQARLFNACFKKHVDERALRWRYDENPHGVATSFVTRESSRGAVSGYACSPRIALAHGDPATAAPIGETGDVMTHPEWRKRGLFSALDRAAMEDTRSRGWPLAFGLPNRRSAHIFLELGWERVGAVRPWTLVLRNDAEARAERSKQGRLRGWLTFRDAARARRARATLRSRAAGVVARRVDSFPSDVDALAAAVARDFALMVRRDAQYLEWRFLRAPSGLHRVIGVSYERGAFAGYVVVQAPRDRESVGYLVDVLGRDESAVAGAIEAGLAELESAGASVVRATAIVGSWWEARLRESGFVAHKPDDELMVILHAHDAAHPLSIAARDPSKWYFTDGDRDDETMG